MIERILNGRLESVIRAPDLADVRVRVKSRRNVNVTIW